MAGGGKTQKLTEEHAKEARIEIIPLIDVIFFLLATFVLFTLSLNRIQSIPINLPQAVPPRPNQNDDDKPITLQVSDSGNYYWNQELITMAEVKYRLSKYVEEPNPRVLLTSDDLAKYGETIKILDAVRDAGIKQVSFETVYRPTGR
ncbi:ExbD/TolR family protein [Synoicihabitans lomoniglobus]|uniref:Biopolymer transporter ExbD n=1 Tax=Synoicihabitans lomoniglobus TaxID=2909285 RepID=A0AAF0CQ71_9BACT|nr:biopolymer transporter ExbD [Opitutaceae bacterium LMO-M01]WED66041.1 biopolymer transporter ExbD [Opitutaceae bacterium LMO-M01]